MTTHQITVRLPGPLLDAARRVSEESMVPLTKRVRRDLRLVIQGDPIVTSFVAAVADAEAQGTVRAADKPYSIAISEEFRNDLRAAAGDTSFSTVLRASMARLVAEYAHDWRALLLEP